MSEPVLLKTSLPYADTSKAFFWGDGWHIFGYSTHCRPIAGYTIKPAVTGETCGKILLIGGVHGNETEGVRFMEDFCREFAYQESNKIFKHEMLLVPLANPDGFVKFQRGNANNVDLNRNMPTKDWSSDHSEPKYFPGEKPNSEPETRVMISILEKFQPDFIISFHSWKPMININGPARIFAEAMEPVLGMPIVEDIGYPTPGSLGTYAGWERQIPTITLEFERGLVLDSIYPKFRDGILAGFPVLETFLINRNKTSNYPDGKMGS